MDDSIYCMISSYFTMACSARAIEDIFTMSVSIKYLFSDWTISYEIFLLLVNVLITLLKLRSRIIKLLLTTTRSKYNINVTN